MPKMKTKSGAKKRFKPTASGMLKAAQAGKRHGMIKRSKNLLEMHEVQLLFLRLTKELLKPTCRMQGKG